MPSSSEITKNIIAYTIKIRKKYEKITNNDEKIKNLKEKIKTCKEENKLNESKKFIRELKNKLANFKDELETYKNWNLDLKKSLEQDQKKYNELFQSNLENFKWLNHDINDFLGSEEIKKYTTAKIKGYKRIRF